MMLKKILLISVVVSFVAASAQENLVPNGMFQNVAKKAKIKGLGAISSAESWTSPTLVPADFYVSKTKVYDISIPENSYGEEKPMEGDNYAGFVAYSYKGKYPRSYLQTKLTKKLEAGKQYCVKMHVSLADLSKYATNNIAMALTDKEMTANNSELLQFDNQIVSKKMTIYEQQYYWIPICGIYTAKGGEEFLTLGNFTEDEKLQTKKVKRPRGFTKPQKYAAYYYLDNISVTPIEFAKKCNCDVTPGMENAETVNKSFNSEGDPVIDSLKYINTDGTSGIMKIGEKTSIGGSADNMSLSSGIDGMLVGFDLTKSNITGNANKSLDAIVVYMKEHTTTTITITGYIDKSEKDIAKLAGKRVSVIYKYLASKGIEKERLDRSIGDDSTPVDPKTPAKNSRVEITILEE